MSILTTDSDKLCINTGPAWYVLGQVAFGNLPIYTLYSAELNMIIPSCAQYELQQKPINELKQHAVNLTDIVYFKPCFLLSNLFAKQKKHRYKIITYDLHELASLKKYFVKPYIGVYVYSLQKLCSYEYINSKITKKYIEVDEINDCKLKMLFFNFFVDKLKK